MKQKIRIARILSVLLIFTMILCLEMRTEAKKSSVKGKIINVVYDDSGSMVKDYINSGDMIKRWSQAKYAMEVFCAMMSEEDTMNVYPMSIEGKLGLTVKGKEVGRVKEIHEMNGKYRNTPFVTVTSAAKDLLKEDPSYERWLIIITDGAFDDGATPTSVVQQTLDSYNEQGIKTVFLAIGNGAQMMKNNISMGAYTEKASDTEVLSKVTNIANQIFTHQILKERYIETSGDKTCLNIDIPTDQIIVFAQGDGVSVGDLSLNGSKIKATDVQNVKYSDVVPENYLDAVTDTSLKGVVATFESGEKPFESGQFSISVSNATTVEYYYKPGVTVKCGLFYDGVEAQSGDELYAGDYEVALSFINPLTGDLIESELLSDAEFSLTVSNNGKEQIIDNINGTVHLEEGEVKIDAIAGLPGHVYLSSKKEYRVLPEPIKLELKFNPENPVYTPDKVGAGAEPVILEITKSQTGELLSDAERDALELTISDANGITWKVKKGEKQGTFELRPVSSGGSIKKIKVETTQFVVNASYQLEYQYAYGSANLNVNFGEYQGSEVQVQINETKNKYNLKKFDDPEALIVTVLYYNSETGKYEKLTEEMWDDFSLNASSEQEKFLLIFPRSMSWDISKGTEVGTWTLKPKYYLGNILFTLDGTVSVNVKAKGESGEYRYYGEGSGKIEVDGMSKEEMVIRIFILLLIIAFILWLIIGYIKKKRLRTGRLNPRCYFKNAVSPKQKISKDIFRVILPYIPERATIRCHKSAYQCNFPDLRVEAVGKYSFKIINKTMSLDSIKINGEFYHDMETLRNARFSWGSFEITSVDRHTKRRLGTFRFN